MGSHAKHEALQIRERNLGACVAVSSLSAFARARSKRLRAIAFESPDPGMFATSAAPAVQAADMSEMSGNSVAVLDCMTATRILNMRRGLFPRREFDRQEDRLGRRRRDSRLAVHAERPTRATGCARRRAAFVGVAGMPRSAGRQGRLRRGRLRRLHGFARRRSGMRLHDAGPAGDRAASGNSVRPSGDGPGRGPAGRELPGRRRGAMRHLHAGNDRLRGRAPSS